MTKITGNWEILTIIGLGLSAGLLATIDITYLLIILLMAFGIMVYIKASMADALLLLSLFLASLVPVNKIYTWEYLYEGLVVGSLAYIAVKYVYLRNKDLWEENRATKQVIFFLLAFAFWGIVSFLANLDSGTSIFKALVPALRPFITIMVILATIIYTKSHDYHNVLKIISYSGLFQALFSIIFYFFGWTNPGGYGIDAVRSYSSLIEFFPYRFTGTLGANFLGGLLIITIPITFYLVLKAPKHRLFWVINLSLQVLTLFFTYTRASIIVIFLELVLFFFLNINKGPKTKFTAVAVIGLLLGIAANIPGLTARFSQDSNDRLALLYAGKETFLNNMFIGIGPGQYPEKIANSALGLFVFTPHGIAGSTPHNSFVLVGAENGIFGLIFLALALGVLGIRLWYKRYKEMDQDKKMLLTIGLVVFIGFLAQNLSNNLLYIPSVAIVFWALMGLLLAL